MPNPPASLDDDPGRPRSLHELRDFVTQQLAAGHSQEVVAQRLVARGWPAVSARHFVANTVASAAPAPTHVDDLSEDEERRLLAELYRRRMIRGLLWAAGGLVIMFVSFSLSRTMGGMSLFFFGAIVFGLIDFVVGLVGWWRNRQ